MLKKLMLEIKDLHVNVDEKKIINGLNLKVNEGEVHALMGPNGSGKSSLSLFLSGRDGYSKSRGSIYFYNHDISQLSPEDRAKLGIFLALQYPVEIPGVTGSTFLKTEYNSLRKARNEEEVSAVDFLKLIRHKQESLNISNEMVKRHLNVGFSGGEKKRFEMLQLSLFDPKFAILDETDSGLDIDALKIVSECINKMRSEKFSMLLITHYQRLLHYVEPDFVHILYEGRIIQSGGKDLALKLEQEGYKDLIGPA